MEVNIDQDYGCWSTGTNDIKRIQLATDIIDFFINEHCFDAASRDLLKNQL